MKYGQQRAIARSRRRRTIRIALREAAFDWAEVAWDSAQRKTVALIDGASPRRRALIYESKPMFGPAAVAMLWTRRTDPYAED